MNRLGLSLVASMLTLGSIPLAQAQTGTTPRAAAPGAAAGVVTATREITATVDAVDPQNRVITLTGPRECRAFQGR